MFGRVKKILFENIVAIISQLFIRVISQQSILKLYKKQQLPNLIARIRVGHIFTSFIFLSFSINDYFLIQDKNTFALITVIRLIIFFSILTPFFLFTFSKNFIKYIRLSLFVTYLILGGYVVFLSFLLDVRQISFFHNYLAINCIIILLFIVLTYNITDTIILVLIYTIGYNAVHFINISRGAFYVDMQFEISHFLDINVWFISISLVSYLMWRYNENTTQQNFLIRNQLEKQKIQLENTDRIKNKFFKIISHDLKNLISPQYSLANFLSERHKNMNEEKRDELIKMIESSSLNTLNVFDELVTWVKAQTNTITIDPQYLKLNDIVNQIYSLLNTNLEEKNIVLNYHINKELLVFCDDNSLKTVLRNIIGNAIKFSFENSKIDIIADKQESSVVIAVIDKGIGIPTNELESVFKVEVSNSKKGTNNEEGTGLGLILCYELLRINRGKIWIESKENEGTTVFIEVPQVAL